MNKVYVVRNQHGMFANKHREWVDGREPKIVFRSPHCDEALNLVFELSSKDIYLRAEAIHVELDDNDQPVVEVTAALPTEPAAEPSAQQPQDGDNADSTETEETLFN
jgi:hypothetical protein